MFVPAVIRQSQYLITKCRSPPFLSENKQTEKMEEIRW
ncbi:hypothetical protein HMPREF1497_2019, partial [Fusobacterium sp. CM21]